MNTTSQKTNAQTRACIDAARTVVPRVFRCRRPADREMRDYFRAHPNLGRRDRNFIYDTVFALFRWWGWVRRFFPAEALAALEPAPGVSREPCALSETRETPDKTLPYAHVSPGRSDPVPDNSPGDADGLPLDLPAPVWRSCFLAALLCEESDLPETVLDWPEAAGLTHGKMLVQADTPRDLDTRWHDVFRLFPRIGPPPPSPAAALLPAWLQPDFQPPIPVEKAMPWIVRRAPLWLRIRKGAAEKVAADLARLGPATTPAPRLPDAVCVTNPGANAYDLESFRRGLIEVQDVSSQAVCAVCSPRPGQTWWDACAGGGGKTLFLAEAVGPGGRVLATDRRRRVLRNLRGRAVRGRFQNIRIKPMDATRPDGLKQVFDGVLVDAPCTGSGTWRRNPDALWRLHPTDLRHMPERQFALLTGVAPRVRPGGRLIYATCSLFRAENEDLVHRFLTIAPDFSLEPFPHPLLENRKSGGMLQLWPWDADGNAMFVARLRRSG